MASKASRTENGKEQPRRRRSNRGQNYIADWGGVNSAKLRSAIAAVAKSGAAIRFGYTRDGGVYAIGVIGDGEPYTEYVRPDEDIDLYLDGLAEDFSG